MEEQTKTIVEIIRTTAKNQSDFLNSIADYIERIELENLNLRSELKKWGATFEQENDQQ